MKANYRMIHIHPSWPELRSLLQLKELPPAFPSCTASLLWTFQGSAALLGHLVVGGGLPSKHPSLSVAPGDQWNSGRTQSLPTTPAPPSGDSPASLPPSPHRQHSPCSLTFLTSQSLDCCERIFTFLTLPLFQWDVGRESLLYLMTGHEYWPGKPYAPE